MIPNTPFDTKRLLLTFSFNCTPPESFSNMLAELSKQTAVSASDSLLPNSEHCVYVYI